MLKSLITALLIFYFHSGYSQVKGPRINALANAGVALQDVWSINSNQAGILGLKTAALSAGYENRFSVKELSTKSAVVVVPYKNYAFGASFQSYGNQAYQDTRTNFSLAKSFGPKLYLALTLNYHQLKIENYNTNNALTVDVGVQYQAFPKLWLGAHLANPNQTHFKNISEQVLPTHLQFGASYLISDKITFSTEVEKVLESNLDLKSGLEYKIVSFLALRGGFSANPFKQYAGFGLDYQNIKIDFAIASHPVLGYSPQISLGYEF